MYMFLNTIIIQGEKRFIKIGTIVCGVIREGFTGVKPVQSKVWGQHFGEAPSSSCGFKRIERERERATAHCLQLWSFSGASLALKGTIVS